jgi:hypothetical protein
MDRCFVVRPDRGSDHFKDWPRSIGASPWHRHSFKANTSRCMLRLLLLTMSCPIPRERPVAETTSRLEFWANCKYDNDNNRKIFWKHPYNDKECPESLQCNNETTIFKSRRWPCRDGRWFHFVIFSLRQRTKCGFSGKFIEQLEGCPLHEEVDEEYKMTFCIEQYLGILACTTSRPPSNKPSLISSGI